MARIEINNLNKAYGDIKVLRDVNLDVAEGEFVVLVGPSGCGKSTLLRTIAGLETASSGEILFNGTNVVNSAPQERNVSMVFQTYALYPHLSVGENISYGLKVHKLPKPEIDRRVAEAAEILQLGDYLDRRPAQLSGGQRQRVAMARAMVREPVVFLYDEPLSNLDAYLRVAMRLEIKNLHSRLKRTSIYVTHDQVEAMTMGDRIVVMKDGVIRQVGTPLELYDDPSDVFVASFIGSPPMNIIDTEVRDGVLMLNGTIPMKAPDHIMAAIGSRPRVKLGLRPEQLRAGRHVEGVDADDHDLHFSAKVESRDDLGQDIIVRADLGGELLTIRTDRHVPSLPGTTIDVALAANSLRLFDAQTEQRLPI